MGCDTQLGDIVHSLGTNLYLHPLAIARRYGSVQRLVAIRLRNRNPIAHTVGVRRVEVAHNRVCQPALRLFEIFGAIDDNTNSEDVVNALERHLLLAHLVPDGVNRFCSALDVVLYTCRIEPLANRLHKALNKVQTLLLAFTQLICNVLVVSRFELRQREVLQLALDVVQTEFVGNLCVEIHRLPRLLLSLLLGEHRYRTHHLQAVGEFYQNDTRVLRI